MRTRSFWKEESCEGSSFYMLGGKGRMMDVYFYDWAKKRPKKHYNRLHEMRIFELIFSKELSRVNLGLGTVEHIDIYCLANPNKDISYELHETLGEICIFVPYDYMQFLNVESVEEKYKHFCELVYLYVVPAIEKYSNLSLETIKEYVNEALQEIEKENYEIVFLVDKTPKKSPSRKKTAILKGIHRSEGFQLMCEVYNDKGLRVVNKLLVEEVGNEVVYSRFLGKLKWENEHLIVVKSKTSSWMEEVHVE
ncbi:hypothetical protein BACERE00185_01109 [Bacillus mobilis]|uniref:Uncharacterized protein n=2 Tax=Bacillus TaxID=1386 RepID=A0A1Y5Z7E3_9BACI|nr:hypothetical protein BACERE00185_01109 [Bacillus mobilis]